MLPGLKRTVREIDWNEFEPQLAMREATERRAHNVGSGQDWRSSSTNSSAMAMAGLASFEPLSIALGYAARSDEPADEIVGAMHAIVSAHPDLNSERAGQYTAPWLRRELLRLRAKDASRDARRRDSAKAVPCDEIFGVSVRDELDLKALSLGDRIAAGALVECCATDPACVLEPDVFAALRVLSQERATRRHWEALLAQLRGSRVDVAALKQAIKAGAEAEVPGDDPEPEQGGKSQIDRLLSISSEYECFRNEFERPFVSLDATSPDGVTYVDTLGVRSGISPGSPWCTSTFSTMGGRRATRRFEWCSIRLRRRLYAGASFAL